MNSIKHLKPAPQIYPGQEPAPQEPKIKPQRPRRRTFVPPTFVYSTSSSGPLSVS